MLKKGLSTFGKLILLALLAVTFMVGFFGVAYMQLRGEEVTIPKIVGKNLNDGTNALENAGLQIKKVASRYSEEPPNTILEQRPKAGTIAKTGLMVSVIVAQANQDGSEAPANVKDDDEAIQEIEQLPELKTDSSKKKSKSTSTSKKPTTKTRDVVKSADGEKTKDTSTDEGDSGGKTGDSSSPEAGKVLIPPSTPKATPKATPKSLIPKPPTSERQKSGDSRP
ncbi:MAG: PASTA domain-containing protein [Pyrinomonadaceae bacterium]